MWALSAFNLHGVKSFVCKYESRHGGMFLAGCPGRPRVFQPVMLKCFESIVVAHSRLADRQCVGTRRHPATLTEKTDLGDSGRGDVWGWRGAVEAHFGAM